jgi:alpha-beta hydrolase superfamily lysophospholipase
VFASLLDVLSLSKDPEIFATDPTTGAFGQRLTENTPTGPIPAPLFIGQGEADSLVLARVQDEYVAARCAAGQALEYRTYAGRDHVPLVEPDSPLIPDLFTWTQDRLDGMPATSTC